MTIEISEVEEKITKTSLSSLSLLWWSADDVPQGGHIHLLFAVYSIEWTI